MSSFVKRIIECSVTLDPKNSGTNQAKTSDGSTTIKMSGSRTTVRVDYSGGAAGSSASVAIYGMTLSLMNQLSTLGMVFNIVPKNTITITAHGQGETPSTIFTGTIVSSYGQFNSSPDVPFNFEANSGLADAVLSTPPTSFEKPFDVATAMSGFARQKGVGFENNGVKIMLPPSYFSGNLQTQIDDLAAHAGIEAQVVNGNVLAIWPKGGNRKTPTVPLLSKDTGMIGYPSYTQQGILLKTIFRPDVNFGGLIKVQSIVKAVSEVSEWAVNKIDHSLDSLMPHGKWESTIYAYNPKYPRSIPSATK